MKLERANTSEAVAAYVLGRLFAGELRSGERLDLDAIAEELGVSRVPVREGLIQLERDGLVERAHYKRAFVAEFDDGTVREAFQLYGMLSALTNRRVARRRDPEVIEALGKLDEALAGCDDPDEFESLAREFRRVVNIAGGGNHLRALLRTFSGLVPVAARFAIDDNLADERSALHAEYMALRGGRPVAAGEAALAHIHLTAENAIAALHRRGVFPATDDGEHGTAHGPRPAHRPGTAHVPAHRPGNAHGDENEHGRAHGNAHGDENEHGRAHGDENEHGRAHGQEHGHGNALKPGRAPGNAHGDENAHGPEHGNAHGSGRAHEHDEGWDDVANVVEGSDP